MDRINTLIARGQNAARLGAVGGYSLVGIIVIALAVIGLLYLFNRA
jgi:hypothetical protein